MFNVFKGLDRTLLAVFFTLACIGFVMMFSASIDYADHKNNSAFFHLKRQSLFWVMALCGATIVLSTPLRVWQKYSWLFLLGGFVLLILVVIPGVGKEVNGSRRWINLGVFNLQASEVAKFGILVYLADYLVRRQDEVRAQMIGMLKPMLVLVFMVVLLLLEPDFGSVVVMGTACMGMIFLGGVRFWQFFSLIAVCVTAGAIMIFSSPYRMRRLGCFVDPWAEANDCGYQLVQSLIAIGRGEWFGTGLGNSVQKLFYLPEAHTDFVFAILAEELGLVGGLLVITLFAFMLARIMLIARRAELANHFFAAYLVYGIGILISAQVFINIGVNTGLLPTKGLTLPFFSYGGSSLIVSTAFIALVLRAEYETSDRVAKVKEHKRRYPLPSKIMQRFSYAR